MLRTVVTRFCGRDSCTVERFYFHGRALFAALTLGEWLDSAGIATPRPDTIDEYFFRAGKLIGWIPPDGVPREGPYHEPVLDNAAGLIGSAGEYRSLFRAQVRHSH